MKSIYRIQELEGGTPQTKTLVVSVPVAWMDKNKTFNFFDVSKSREVNRLSAKQVLSFEIKALKEEIWTEIRTIIENNRIRFVLEDGTTEIHPVDTLLIGNYELLENMHESTD